MLKRLTEKQRDTFIVIINYPSIKDGSLRFWAKKNGISHIALLDRLDLLEKKKYIYKEDGKWFPTSEGIESVMNDGIHNRFIKTRKYDRRTNGEEHI